MLTIHRFVLGTLAIVGLVVAMMLVPGCLQSGADRHQGPMDDLFDKNEDCHGCKLRLEIPAGMEGYELRYTKPGSETVQAPMQPASTPTPEATPVPTPTPTKTTIKKKFKVEVEEEPVGAPDVDRPAPTPSCTPCAEEHASFRNPYGTPTDSAWGRR